MDIGSMRQRIILQKHILHTDEIGNHQSHWEKFYSCFAYVNLASGKENVTDIETLSEDTLVFILRWCEKLREINKKQYRILFENEVYNIICVDDVQFTHKKLKLTAVREIRGGKNEPTGDI